MELATKRYGWILRDGQPKRVHILEYSKQDGRVRDDLGRLLISRQGTKMSWHFAFSPGQVIFDCDRKEYKNKTLWHELWQSYSPSSHVEVYRWKNIENDTICHIADLIDKEGYIVEFQHSSISLEDVRSREQVYDQMYWIIDATDSDWIPLVDKIIVKQKHGWWSRLSKPIFLDIGIGIACVERSYSLTVEKSEDRYNQIYYYLCRLVSYNAFITSRIILKEGATLHPSHQVGFERRATPLQTFKYCLVYERESAKIECTSKNTYEHRGLLKEFGLDWNPESKQHETRLYNTKELSDLTARYKRETIKRDAILTKCKSLLTKIKWCSESNDVVISTGLSILPGVTVKLHSETIEHYKRLYEEASVHQNTIEILQKEVIPFSQGGLVRIIEQRETYQGISEILTMLDSEGWSTEEQMREKDKQEEERIKQEEERIKQEKFQKERAEQLVLMAKQKEEQNQLNATYREKRKKELEEEKLRWEEERPMREAKAKEERMQSEQIRSMMEEQKLLEEEREEPAGNVLLASSLCKKCRRQMTSGKCIICTRSILTEPGKERYYG